MKTSRRAYYRRAFVLTEEDVNALVELLSAVGPPKCSIKCSDDLTRTFENIEALLKFDNSPLRAINELSIDSRDWDTSTSGSIKLENVALYPNVTLHLEGADNQITKLNDELEARLAGMRPWYAVFTSLKIVVPAFVLLLFTVGLTLIDTAWSVSPNELNSQFLQGLQDATLRKIAVIAALAVWGVQIGGLITLPWWFNRLLPVGSFAIGQGKSRYELREKVRWGVVIALVVGVLGSLIVALIV